MDEELRVVLEDLNFLNEEWDQDVTDDSLRRSSPVLRRFLVEEQLLRAWRKIGLSGQPEILAFTLSRRLTLTPLNEVRFASAGGATYKALAIAQAFEIDRALSPAEVQKVFALGLPEIRQSLTDFTNATCIIVEGTEISRRDLIKYVANKLGGAHYDEQRDRDYQRLLDHVGQTRVIAGKNAVYFELLSAGQRLIQAPDIVNLRNRLRQQLHK
jgi:hypothetical protein